MHGDVLALDHVFDLGLSAVLDAFQTANELAAASGLAAPRFDVRVVDARPSQSVYALTDHLVHADPIVERFETWARARLKDGFSLDAAGEGRRPEQAHAGTAHGRRAGPDAARLFPAPARRARGAPAEDGNGQRRRGRRARGYSNGATLRTLLRRELNRGIREIRRD